MLSLWCRTAGSRASNVGAALGDERCGGDITCHKYDRAVYIDCQRQGSIVMVISKGEKSRRYVVSTFGCLPKNENKPFDGSWCLLVSYWPLAS